MICKSALISVILLGAIAPVGLANVFSQEAREVCPTPVLSRLQRHRVAPGETLETIARQYNLIAATLMGLNPSLRDGVVSVGQEILIPPYNGIQIEVEPGQTWVDVARAHNTRADVIFEVNGCQPEPRVVFIPGVNWAPAPPVTLSPDLLSGHPLPMMTEVLFRYGWQLDPVSGQVVFHGGIDLSAPTGTPVLAVGKGVVAFAGYREGYGNLVVVNHAQGKQTRYAHLLETVVDTGQQVALGETLGLVGQTGRPSSDRPHLHFEVRYNSNLGWVAEDPSHYLNIQEADSQYKRRVRRQ
ncbi:MAG: M23 family metallopeptidase [Limnospira sp. PMC 1291.21]|uniref:LysM peptidoglycan-binding domain-containing M23 family metallopeptidase n=1 Tax=unclassified Limnospira TaxID=2642885 RepID=UPI0028E177C1|nr:MULTISPECIES: M23 family metallopeptidase [unclassified Limnospira]MDT9206121.1 M23 family metallopeptidase [Limnospira sp. PMC 1243.20]MDT9287714.1 M23 family metallopeptidase [Limnospira sp. PMC 1298.21]MDT9318469.1 M23 family metallopeptidase [Limnospira sp. PMC 1306.21]MDT9180544.1 M23 family metallopeptidase [Limnospira sp. PMC 1238.20]MDT9195856.1 M23 family metallopeptidase [Limnospira sp. PMC 1245.20]